MSPLATQQYILLRLTTTCDVINQMMSHRRVTGQPEAMLTKCRHFSFFWLKPYTFLAPVFYAITQLIATHICLRIKRHYPLQY